MKKKVVSLLLVTTMVASLAAGCGDSSSSGDGTEKTGKKVETVDDGHTLTQHGLGMQTSISRHSKQQQRITRKMQILILYSILRSSQGQLTLRQQLQQQAQLGITVHFLTSYYSRITTSSSTIQIILMHGYQQMMQMLSGMISVRRSYHSLQSTENTLDSLLITEQLSLLTEQIFLSRQDTQSMI